MIAMCNRRMVNTFKLPRKDQFFFFYIRLSEREVKNFSKFESKYLLRINFCCKNKQDKNIFLDYPLLFSYNLILH